MTPPLNNPDDLGAFAFWPTERYIPERPRNATPETFMRSLIADEDTQVICHCESCGATLLLNGPMTRTVLDQGEVIWRGCSSCWEEYKAEKSNVRALYAQNATYRALLADLLSASAWENPQATLDRIRQTIGMPPGGRRAA